MLDFTLPWAESRIFVLLLRGTATLSLPLLPPEDVAGTLCHGRVSHLITLASEL